MRRGEVYITNLDDEDTVGREQNGTRPSIIVQINAFNEGLDTVIVIPTTTNLKRLAINSSVLINRGEGGLDEDSVALCNQIRVIDKVRLVGDPLGMVSANTLNEIKRKLIGVLGLS